MPLFIASFLITDKMPHDILFTKRPVVNNLQQNLIKPATSGEIVYINTYKKCIK